MARFRAVVDVTFQVEVQVEATTYGEAQKSARVVALDNLRSKLSKSKTPSEILGWTEKPQDARVKMKTLRSEHEKSF